MDNQQNNWFRNPQDDMLGSEKSQNEGSVQREQVQSENVAPLQSQSKTVVPEQRQSEKAVPLQGQSDMEYVVPQQNYGYDNIGMPTNEYEKKNKRLKMIIIALVCIVVLALVAVACVLLMGGDGSGSQSGGSGEGGNGQAQGGGEKPGERVEYNVGDYITFGRYDLDGKKQNGTEAIEWLVLAEEKGQTLVISKDIIFTNRFTNERNSGDQWDNSEIRKIMNVDFYDEAFNEDEKGMIYTTKVEPGKNPYYGIDAGKSTRDKLFLLSVDEVTKYLPTEKDRQCSMSGLAEMAAGAFTAAWCTRTPGEGESTVVVLYCADGVIQYDGLYKANPFGVRPAMWIDSELLKEYVPNDGRQNGGEGENDGEGGETPPPEAITVCEVGDIITYGKFEQDNVKSNGAEEIAWLVLDVQDGKALVLSESCLEWLPYNTTDTSTTWGTCTLRGWLNDEFWDSAFSEGEKAMICTTTVPGAGNQGKSTNDKVFLLSTSEWDKYREDCVRNVPTKYAAANIEATVVDNPNIDMDRVVYDSAWCRSDGGKNATSASLAHDELYTSEVSVAEYRLVRPAMWIELSE